MILETQQRYLVATLLPLRQRAARLRGLANLTGHQMQQVGELEAALNAAADLLETLNPPPTLFMTRVQRLLGFHEDPAPLSAAKLRYHYPDSPFQRA